MCVEYFVVGVVVTAFGFFLYQKVKASKNKTYGGGGVGGSDNSDAN